jgi:hypothetical protein
MLVIRGAFRAVPPFEVDFGRQNTEMQILFGIGREEEQKQGTERMREPDRLIN